MGDEEGIDSSARKSKDDYGWARCAELVNKHDKAKIDYWNDEINALLVFVCHITSVTWQHANANMMDEAGLFSAVVTAFVVPYYLLLSPDVASQIMANISAQIRSFVINSNFINSTYPAYPNSPIATLSGPTSPSTIGINILWFSALITSLTSASIAISVKQWLNQHTLQLTSVPRVQVLTWYLRHRSFAKWDVPFIINLVPLLLQLSLLLFYVGIIVLLWSLNLIVAIVVVSLTGLSLLFLIVTAVLPAIFVNHCPYKSPQALFTLTLVRTILRMPYFCWFVARIILDPVGQIVAILLSDSPLDTLIALARQWLSWGIQGFQYYARTAGFRLLQVPDSMLRITDHILEDGSQPLHHRLHIDWSEYQLEYILDSPEALAITDQMLLTKACAVLMDDTFPNTVMEPYIEATPLLKSACDAFASLMAYLTDRPSTNANQRMDSQSLATVQRLAQCILGRASRDGPDAGADRFPDTLLKGVELLLFGENIDKSPMVFDALTRLVDKSWEKFNDSDRRDVILLAMDRLKFYPQFHDIDREYHFPPPHGCCFPAEIRIAMEVLLLICPVLSFPDSAPSTISADEALHVLDCLGADLDRQLANGTSGNVHLVEKQTESSPHSKMMMLSAKSFEVVESEVDKYLRDMESKAKDEQEKYEGWSKAWEKDLQETRYARTTQIVMSSCPDDRVLERVKYLDRLSRRQQSQRDQSEHQALEMRVGFSVWRQIISSIEEDPTSVGYGEISDNVSLIFLNPWDLSRLLVLLFV
ncbi:uncharacterized protein FIBRA_08040 [Fibroporia radiculosa]|uniref:DUF6535 domain-containing protein n=1 Tax=Fibroporia radiculosa TaxID=599839 RepID=J4IC52_9APHY|nr:uncharacterized protein FIBRA_08040 [Fibroporia radiculosa]CCM05806.1 predicted protein [Fibroporia radiculosa]